MRATAVIPVKRFGSAKTRLDGVLDRGARARIAEAMLDDVLGAVVRAERIERIVAVTGERRAERVALERAKRATTPIEVLRDPTDVGHSAAATLGALRASALGAACVAMLPGDCPLIDPAELDSALARMEPGRVAIVPDRHGTGTNALLLCPPDAIGPAFGEHSRQRHERLGRAAGRRTAVESIASLALDLDTPDDLTALRDALAADPSAAPRTAEACREIGGSPPGPARRAGARA